MNDDGRPPGAAPVGGSGPPPNARIGRQRYLTAALWVLLVITIVAAAATLVLPQEAAEVTGRGTVVVLIAAPIVRVTWLFVRWARLGDRRYALAAAALLGVLGAAALLR